MIANCKKNLYIVGVDISVLDIMSCRQFGLCTFCIKYFSCKLYVPHRVRMVFENKLTEFYMVFFFSSISYVRQD